MHTKYPVLQTLTEMFSLQSVTKQHKQLKQVSVVVFKLLANGFTILTVAKLGKG